jgi:hypothetical protein
MRLAIVRHGVRVEEKPGLGGLLADLRELAYAPK